MTIKYNKYAKSTVSSIKEGVIEVFASDTALAKEILLPYQGLKVGIAVYKKFPNSLDFALLKATEVRGMYMPKWNTIYVTLEATQDISSTIRHELLHACQHQSRDAAQEIEEEARKLSTLWKNVELGIKGLYPSEKWDIEIPVWVLESKLTICHYFIDKYLR